MPKRDRFQRPLSRNKRGNIYSPPAFFKENATPRSADKFEGIRRRRLAGVAVDTVVHIFLPEVSIFAAAKPSTHLRPERQRRNLFEKAEIDRAVFLLLTAVAARSLGGHRFSFLCHLYVVAQENRFTLYYIY